MCIHLFNMKYIYILYIYIYIYLFISTHTYMYIYIFSTHSKIYDSYVETPHMLYWGYFGPLGYILQHAVHAEDMISDDNLWGTPKVS